MQGFATRSDQYTLNYMVYISQKGKSFCFIYGSYARRHWHEITDMDFLKFSLFINRANVRALAYSKMRVIRCVTSVRNNITYLQSNHKLSRFLAHGHQSTQRGINLNEIIVQHNNRHHARALLSFHLYNCTYRLHPQNQNENHLEQQNKQHGNKALFSSFQLIPSPGWGDSEWLKIIHYLDLKSHTYHPS